MSDIPDELKRKLIEAAIHGTGVPKEVAEYGVDDEVVTFIRTVSRWDIGLIERLFVKKIDE